MHPDKSPDAPRYRHPPGYKSLMASKGVGQLSTPRAIERIGFLID